MLLVKSLLYHRAELIKEGHGGALPDNRLHQLSNCTYPWNRTYTAAVAATLKQMKHPASHRPFTACGRSAVGRGSAIRRI